MNPLSSIIIPVYNDPQGIKTTIQSLNRQNTAKRNYEIIIADNGSTDVTQKLVREYETSYENVELVIENDIQSSYAARNKGITKADGEIIAFLDADMWVDPDWLDSIISYFHNNEEVMYLGYDVVIQDSEDSSFAAKYNKLTGFDVERYISKKDFCPTCCLTVRRDIFDRVGEFNENLISGGDAEFGYRVKKEGIKLYYTPKISAYHPPRETYLELVKKSLRIGKGQAQLSEYAPEIFKDRHKTTNASYLMSLSPFKNKYMYDFWGELTLIEKVKFYLLQNFIKTAILAGRLQEKYKT